MTKALELAKFGRESAPTGLVVGDSDAQTLSQKTFSDMPVFSSGTANTVAFLNASKVLSSSTVLAFDGTNLGVGVASPGFRLDIGGGDGTNMAIRSTGTTDTVIRGYVNGSESGTVRFINGGGIKFETAGIFRAQLSSTGYFSLGTTTATEVLTVSNSNYESFGLYRNLDYNSVGAMGVRMYFGGFVGTTPTRSAAIDGTLMTATTGRMSFSNLIGGVLTESLRIETNGSVRIGGTFAAQASSAEKLTVDGGTSQATTLANTSDSYGTVYIKNKSNTAATIQPYIYFNDADGGNRAGFGVKYTDASLHHFAQGGFNWYTGSSGFSGSRATLTSTGLLLNVSGGNSGVASALLHVSANGLSNTYGTMRLEGANRGGILEMYNASYPVSKIITDQSGNFTIQTSASFATSTLYDRMLIDTNGKVLIGISSAPYSNVTSWNLYSSGMATGLSGSYTYGVYGGSLGNLTLTANAYPANTGSTHYVSIASGSSGGGGPQEIARFTNQGYVGIGTTDPQSLLTINSGGTDSLANTTINQTTDFAATSRAGFSGLANNNGGFYFGMGANGTGIPAGFGFFREATGWNTALAFYTNNQTSGSYSTRAMQEKMRLTSDGNLLLGSTLNYGKLSIRDTAQKAAVTINNDAYFKMYGKLISTYNTAVSNHALCTLGSNTNIGYIAKITITTVSATSQVYNVSEAYVFARWLGGIYQGGVVTQPVTQNHTGMSTCIYTISLVGNGTNLDIAVSCSSPSNYITTSFDVEITCRDAGSVVWYPNYHSVG